MTLENGARVHLIGICGTAMAGLAGLLKARGYRVTGSDEGVYPPMSTFLEGLGIKADSGFDEAHLEPAPDLVVVGNAIRRGNPEAELMLDRRMPFTSLPALVKELLLPGRQVAVVAGTHGKTTTSSMLAHILAATGRDPSFLIGGIPLGTGVPAKLGSGRAIVLEGDEYDTAFFDKGPKLMHYIPDVAILNAVEMDHADIYKDFETVQLQFRRWVNIIPRGSLLLVNGDDATAVAVSAKALCRVERFGQNEANEWRIEDLQEGSEGTRFVLHRSGRAAVAQRDGGPATSVVEHASVPAGQPAGASVKGTVVASPSARASEFSRTMGRDAAGRGEGSERFGPRIDIALPTSGAFNARNAVAAIVASHELGVPLEEAAAGMSRFPGVKRRLEVKGQARGVTVVDDFAHHPTAIRETIRAARARWPEGRIIAILEPRSWSLRRNIFQSELAPALASASAVVIADVYHGEMLPASERLDVPRLVAEIEARGVPARHLAGAPAIVKSLAPELRPGDIVLVMSNGGFEGIHDRFLTLLAG